MKKLQQQEPLANFFYCPGCIKDHYSFSSSKEKAPRFDSVADWFVHLYTKHYKTIPSTWGFTNTRKINKWER